MTLGKSEIQVFERRLIGGRRELSFEWEGPADGDVEISLHMLDFIGVQHGRSLPDTVVIGPYLLRKVSDDNLGFVHNYAMYVQDSAFWRTRRVMNWLRMTWQRIECTALTIGRIWKVADTPDYAVPSVRDFGKRPEMRRVY